MRNKMLVFTSDTCQNRPFGNTYALGSYLVNYLQLQGCGRGLGGGFTFDDVILPALQNHHTADHLLKVGKSFLKHETALINESGLK